MPAGPKTPLVETDVLVAAIDPEDPHHSEASAVISYQNIAFTPYILLELDLLLKSGRIEVLDYEEFWHKIGDLITFYRIKILSPGPIYHAEAARLRALYNLSYFDSLHAATAIVENTSLISYDKKAYSRIRGLRYVHPKQFIANDT